MSEEGFYNQETPMRPEYNAVPEHRSLPEYNPVYPDVSFFKESTVTTREENIFQGEPPAGEPRRITREERRKLRERYSLLQKLLGSALRGGAAVLSAAVVISAVSFGQEGGLASAIRNAVSGAKKPAFTQQVGYDPDALLRLWERDPDAPHKYDTEHPLVYVAATCTQDGEEEYVCLECGVHAHNILAAHGHTDGDPVKENEVAATCLAEGSYIRIIRCSVCGEELSRETITVAKSAHTPGEPEHADEVEPTCTEEGSYAEVVVCAICGEEISRTIVTVAATGHTPEQAVREHEQEATCTEGGSYEEVIYCADCGEEVSRRTVTVAALGHSAADAVREQEVEATCTTDGSYDEVVYCSRCSEIISRIHRVIAALGHSYETVRQNVVEAECEREGGYDEVQVCSRCGVELSDSRVHVVQLSLGHDYQYTKEYESVSCLRRQFYYISKCSRCGALEPGAVASEAEFEAGDGHNWQSSGGVVYCVNCFEQVINASYYNAYVYYSLSSDYMEEKGIEVVEVKLYCYDAQSYINEGGYEWDISSQISVPDSFAEPGTRFRVDITFSDGSTIRSNDVTAE